LFDGDNISFDASLVYIYVYIYIYIYIKTRLASNEIYIYI